MNKMKLAGLAIGVASMLAVATPAFAATATNVQFDNGDVTISGQGGSTVNATFRIVVPANQVVEQIQTDVIGDSLAPVCTSVGGDLGLQEGTQTVTLPITLPPNTGTYGVQIQGAGIYGGIRSVDCNDNVVLPATTFNSAVRTVADSSGTSIGGTTASDLSALIKAILLSMGIGSTTTTPPPVTDAQCAAFTAANLGTQPNVYSSANIALQGYLLSQHMSIPALTSGGASFGFYGNQTTNAVGMWRSMHPSCA